MATLDSYICSGNCRFTDGSTKYLQEVYAGVDRESRQLTLFEKNMLTPLRTCQLAEGKTLGVDSGVIQQKRSGLFKRGKEKEYHYVSFVQKEETITLVFDSKLDRTTWKGSLVPILNLEKDPKRMSLFSTSRGSEAVTVHVNDSRIAVISDRVEDQPARLKIVLEILDIKSHSIMDSNQIVLITNQGVTYQLEGTGLKALEDLATLNKHITTRKKRMKPSMKPDPLPPPPPPCPGPDPFKDPFAIYQNPVIVQHFKPERSKNKHTSFDLNTIADNLPENLEDIEKFSDKRTALFNKFTTCYQRSTTLSKHLQNVGDVHEITSPFEEITIDSQLDAQADLSDIALDEEEKVIYMVGYTIHKVIREAPDVDTLQLSPDLRAEICMSLYSANIGSTRHDWKMLANEIGLTYKAVNMIHGFIQNQMTPGYQTCAEIVLRHWQYTYNKYPETHSHHPKHPCTQKGLRLILKNIGRHDLCRLMDQRMHKT